MSQHNNPNHIIANLRKEVLMKISNIEIIDATLKNANPFDRNKIHKNIDDASFSYVSFFYDPDFNLATHCTSSLERAWSFLQKAFTADELIKNGFNNKLFSKKGINDPDNKNKLIQALIIWSVCRTTNHNHNVSTNINNQDKNLILDKHALNGFLSVLCKARPHDLRETMPLIPREPKIDNEAESSLIKIIGDENLWLTEFDYDDLKIKMWVNENYPDLMTAWNEPHSEIKQSIKLILYKTYHYGQEFHHTKKHNDKIQKIVEVLVEVVKLNPDKPAAAKDRKPTANKCEKLAHDLCKSPAKSIWHTIGLKLDSIKAALQRTFTRTDYKYLEERHSDLFASKKKHDLKKNLRRDMKHLARQLHKKQSHS